MICVHSSCVHSTPGVLCTAGRCSTALCDFFLQISRHFKGILHGGHDTHDSRWFGFGSGFRCISCFGFALDFGALLWRPGFGFALGFGTLSDMLLWWLGFGCGYFGVLLRRGFGTLLRLGLVL